MYPVHALAGTSAMLMVTAGLALGDAPPGPRGHALGPDLAAIAQPLPGAGLARGGHAFGQDLAALEVPIVPARPARGGHALGHDLAALDKPLDCTAAAVVGNCPTEEATLEPADLAPGD
jgi:hypothetical protein